VSRDPERFLVLVCRELGAVDARIIFAEDEGERAPDPTEIRCPMASGRQVVARFDRAPEDAEARKRRLEMLVAAFDAVAVEGPPSSRRSRPPPALSLREELEGLCERAGAVNAIVVDANSPVMWGAARSEGLVEVPPLPSTPTLPTAIAGGEATPGPDVAATSRRALRVVRALPEMAALRKGKPLRYVERTGETPLVAHAFASIYLLVVVFDAGVVFDELRAERSIVESLPRIERLVLALPPHEPEPTQGAGVIAMRRPRRRSP
jgi:hypothetical protein